MWLKRLNALSFWKTPLKRYKYVISPSPGSHPKNYCIPLAIIIRDILKYAENLKEAKNVIKQRKVLVDQRVISNYKFPCGLFDVISFPEIDEHYRITADEKGLNVIKISESEAFRKVVKVKKKTKISSNTYQLTFHDGKNILSKDNQIKPHDSLLIELPNLNILQHLSLKEDMLCLIFRGRNCGIVGRVTEIIRGSIKQDWLIELKTENNKILTTRDYVIAIGKENSLISI